jgi:hypothetical protein
VVYSLFYIKKREMNSRFYSLIPKLVKPRLVLVDLPLKKSLSNIEMVNQIDNFERIDGLVLSDKAGGHDYFCEAENLIQRNIIPQLKHKLRMKGHGTNIYCVLRTGDRCVNHLQFVIDELIMKNNVTGFILVSGHDYRTKLKVKARLGEPCRNNLCRTRMSISETSKNILCGGCTFDVLDKQLLNFYGKPKGAILSTHTTNVKPNVDFYVTHACPMTNTTAWLDKLNPKGNVQRNILVTVIPALNKRELEMIVALGAEISVDQYDFIEKNLVNHQNGLELAKECIESLLTHPSVMGFYLYAFNPKVLSELAAHAHLLCDGSLRKTTS